MVPCEMKVKVFGVCRAAQCLANALRSSPVSEVPLSVWAWHLISRSWPSCGALMSTVTFPMLKSLEQRFPLRKATEGRRCRISQLWALSVSMVAITWSFFTFCPTCTCTLGQGCLGQGQTVLGTIMQAHHPENKGYHIWGSL